MKGSKKLRNDVYYAHIFLEGSEEIITRFIGELGDCYSNKCKDNAETVKYWDSYDNYVDRERNSNQNNLKYNVDKEWLYHFSNRISEVYKIFLNGGEAKISIKISDVSITELIRVLARKIPSVKVSYVLFSVGSFFVKYLFIGDIVYYYSDTVDSKVLTGINNINLEKIEAECIRLLNSRSEYVSENNSKIDVNEYEPF